MPATFDSTTLTLKTAPALDGTFATVQDGKGSDYTLTATTGTPNNYYYDPATQTFGGAWDFLENDLRCFMNGGGTMPAFIWDQGFTVFDGATKATISSVTQSAGVFTITLSAVPAGAVTLSYGYNDLPDVTDYTKLVVDDNAIPLSLKHVTALLPF